jgi:hypothetical protein
VKARQGNLAAILPGNAKALHKLVLLLFMAARI